MDITVIVVTFNPEYCKLFSTLFSIIIQENIQFDIIIADDGSLNFDENCIKQWFDRNNFYDYKIIANKKNGGTVLNCQKAIKSAKGKYIKLISPGDYLYDNHVLCDFVNYMQKKKISVCFGNFIAYNLSKTGNLHFHEFYAPKNILPFLSKNVKLIQWNYLISRDYILGASFVFERKQFQKYLKQIAGKVKYAEDCAVILMVADGIRIDYFNRVLIWYEYGTGISTNKSKKWERMLYKDNKEIFKILGQYEKWKDLYDIHFEKKHDMRREIIKKLNTFEAKTSQKLYKRRENNIDNLIRIINCDKDKTERE